jgi:plasmid stability protein
MEAEVRDILKITLKRDIHVPIGDALANLGQRLGLTRQDLKVIEGVHETVPAEPVTFE